MDRARTVAFIALAAMMLMPMTLMETPPVTAYNEMSDDDYDDFEDEGDYGDYGGGSDPWFVDTSYADFKLGTHVNTEAYWLDNDDGDKLYRAGDVRLEIKEGVGGWVERKDYPGKTYFGEACTGAGDKIYVIRGHYSSGTQFYRYDPDSDSWGNLNNQIPWPQVWLSDGHDLYENKDVKNGTAIAWDNGDYIYLLVGDKYDPNDEWGTTRRAFFRYSIPISNDSWQILENTPWSQGTGDTMAWVRLGDTEYIYAWIGATSHRADPSKLGARLARFNITAWNDDPDNEPTKWENLYWQAGYSSRGQTGTIPYGADDGSSLVWTGGDYLYYLVGAYNEGLDPNDERHFLSYGPLGGVSTWSELAQTPYNASGGVDDGGSLVWLGGDYLYALKGGDDGGGVPANNFWRYNMDPNVNTWEDMRSVPLGPAYYNGSRLGVAGGKIYYWRGYQSDDPNDFYEFQPTYYTSGTFTSRTFNAGATVRWKEIVWDTGPKFYVGDEPKRLIDGKKQKGKVIGGSLEDTRLLDGTYENIREKRARAVYFVENEAGGETTSTSFENAAVLTVAPELEGRYLITATALMAADYPMTAEVGRVEIQLLKEGVAYPYALKNFTPNGPPDNYVFSTHKVVFLPVDNHRFIVQYRNASPTPRKAMISRVRLTAMRIEETEFAAQENELPDSTTSTNPVDRVSLTFVPEAPGDYLVLATAGFSGSNTDYSTVINLYHENSTISENLATSQRAPTEAGENYTFVGMRSLYLPPTPQTFKIQYRTTGAVATIRNARIIVVRADELGTLNYKENDAEVSDNSGDWISESLTINPATTENHLITASAMVRRDEAMAGVRARLLVNGVDYGMEYYTAQSAGDYVTFHMVRKVELAAGSHTIELQWSTPAPSQTSAYIKQRRIIALQLPKEYRYFLNWEHRITGAVQGYDSYIVRVRGKTSRDDEGMYVHIWNKTLNQGNGGWEKIGTLDKSEKTISMTISNIGNYIVGENISIRYKDVDPKDSTLTRIHIDYCAVDAIDSRLTINMYTQTSTNGQNWTGQEGPYEGVGENTINLDDSQYIRYKAVLQTDNENMTPVLRDVRISYT